MTPLMIFDGDCGFCRVWIEYWKRLTGERVAYEPYQKVGGDFPDIPTERFARAVHLALPDGRVLSGAEAVLQTLAFVPGRGWPLALYRHLPGFAGIAEWLYGFIAAHRPLFFRLTKLLIGPVVEPACHARVQWLFWKALGVIYACAFFSLASQIAGLIGSRGILPVSLYLSRISGAFGASRYWNFPTVFWIGSSDFALKLACAAGVVFSILIVAGVFERESLIACWVLYLSLTTAGQDFLNFQWDILLLETGFLAIFLGFSPVVVWLFRWLLFRLMLMSGAVKLLSGDAVWSSLTALKYHYQTQPLPTPVAWYMQQFPGWFQEASVVVMFAIELGAPLLIFAPRRVRFFAGCSIVFLQVLILLTGNYTYFNWLTIALCVPLLDDLALKRICRSAVCPPAGFLCRHTTSVVAIVLVLVSSEQIVAQFFPGIRPLRYVEQVLSPLNLTNTYGLFAVMTTVRREIVVEGSNDGSSWSEYEFKYKPGDIYTAPRWVAPLQPRLDWQMWFAALGSYRNNPWFVNFVFRLLEGSPDVVSLLGRDPFAGAPPQYVRAVVYEYTFTDWSTRRKTGAWWNRGVKGNYLPAVSLRDFQRSE